MGAVRAVGARRGHGGVDSPDARLHLQRGHDPDAGAGTHVDCGSGACITERDGRSEAAAMPGCNDACDRHEC